MQKTKNTNKAYFLRTMEGSKKNDSCDQLASSNISFIGTDFKQSIEKNFYIKSKEKTFSSSNIINNINKVLVHKQMMQRPQQKILENIPYHLLLLDLQNHEENLNFFIKENFEKNDFNVKNDDLGTESEVPDGKINGVSITFDSNKSVGGNNTKKNILKNEEFCKTITLSNAGMKKSIIPNTVKSAKNNKKNSENNHLIQFSNKKTHPLPPHPPSLINSSPTHQIPSSSSYPTSTYNTSSTLHTTQPSNQNISPIQDPSTHQISTSISSSHHTITVPKTTPTLVQAKISPHISPTRTFFPQANTSLSYRATSQSHTTPQHSSTIQSHTIPSHTTPFHTTPSHTTPSHTTPSQPTLPQTEPLHKTPPHVNPSEIKAQNISTPTCSAQSESSLKNFNSTNSSEANPHLNQVCEREEQNDNYKNSILPENTPYDAILNSSINGFSSPQNSCRSKLPLGSEKNIAHVRPVLFLNERRNTEKANEDNKIDVNEGKV